MKVMLIDDERDNLILVERCLSMNNFETYQYEDPRLAVEDFRREHFDVVLTDIKMPYMNGMQVLSEIKNINPSTYVLLMTGFADVKTAIAAINDGAYAFFNKPLDIERVIATFEKIDEEIACKTQNAIKEKNIEETARELDDTYDDLQRHAVILDQLQSLNQKIHSEPDIDNIMRELSSGSSHLLGCEYCIMDYLEESSGIRRRYINDDPVVTGDISNNEEMFPLSILLGGKNEEMNNNPSVGLRFSFEEAGIKLNNYICVSMIKNGKVIGQLSALNKAGGFGGNDKFLLRALSSNGITAISNIGLINELKSLFKKTVGTLTRAIEARDNYTHDHIGRVTEYAMALAGRVGFDNRKLEAIHIGTLLHDIGKIGIPDAILNKPGPLSDEEFGIMKDHVNIGVAMLRDIGQLKDVLPCIEYHHERVDGKGYPKGKAGEDIPVEGRIVAIADAFDAMTSDRPYREKLPREEAINRLKGGSGTQFDSGLLEIFLALIEEGAFDELDSERIPRVYYGVSERI